MSGTGYTPGATVDLRECSTAGCMRIDTLSVIDPSGNLPPTSMYIHLVPRPELCGRYEGVLRCALLLHAAVHLDADSQRRFAGLVREFGRRTHGTNLPGDERNAEHWSGRRSAGRRERVPLVLRLLARAGMCVGQPDPRRTRVLPITSKPSRTARGTSGRCRTSSAASSTPSSARPGISIARRSLRTAAVSSQLTRASRGHRGTSRPATPITFGAGTWTPGSNNPVTTQPTDPVTGDTPVKVTFTAVGIPGGSTTVTSSPTGPDLPYGYEVGGTYYDVTTTASYTPPVTLCFSYNPTAFPPGYNPVSCTTRTAAGRSCPVRYTPTFQRSAG